MFVVGMGSLGWMLVLAAVMAAEKNLRWGRRLRTPLGLGLIAWAGVLVADPRLALRRARRRQLLPPAAKSLASRAVAVHNAALRGAAIRPGTPLSFLARSTSPSAGVAG